MYIFYSIYHIFSQKSVLRRLRSGLSSLVLRAETGIGDQTSMQPAVKTRVLTNLSVFFIALSNPVLSASFCLEHTSYTITAMHHNAFIQQQSVQSYRLFIITHVLIFSSCRLLCPMHFIPSCCSRTKRRQSSPRGISPFQ